MTKKRLLFVEDNPLLLSMYELMMSDERDRWEIATAASAEDALPLLHGSAFDVVLSDMNMPGMNGAVLIGEVMKLHPHASRIIISGQNEQEEVARCLGVTHQFLPKPFDVKALKAALHRISGLDAYLQDEKLKALVGRLDGLPAFPSLYLEMMDELGSEEPDLAKIAASIAKDPGMTAKVLHVVNSAAFGLSRKITSPLEAVQYLGLNTVSSLVLSAHVFQACPSVIPDFSPDALWEHGTRTAKLAKQIMRLESAAPADAEDAHVAGMLHDIGKLMLAGGLPGQYRQMLTLATERSISQAEAEAEVFGATHAGVAAYLFGLWGLPASIVEVVAFHHVPQRSDLRCFSPLTAVHVANVLAHELDGPAAPNPRPVPDLDYLRALGVEHRLEVWRNEAARLFGTQGGT